MSTRIHPQARTTPKIRQEIKDSGLSDRQAAKVFNITRATAAKWINRDDVQDRSHRAHTLHTTLSVVQEAIVLSLRQTLYLPLDDLLYITRQYINPEVSRSGIARLLKREGMARLADARRDIAPLPLRGNRPRHALGLPAHLRRHDGQEQRRLPASAQAGLADQDHQTADR